MKDKRFFVYIIESPSERELYENKLEGKVLSESLNITGIDSHYSLSVDKCSFGDAIERKLDQILNCDWDRKIPILHISAHGNKEGIALTSGAFISWENFRQRLNEINTKCNNNLVVTFSSCFGAYAAQLAFESGRAPYYAVVGSTKVAELSDLAIGYSSFFHVVRKTWDLNEAFEALKVASCNHDFEIVYGSSAESKFYGSFSKF